MGYALEKCWTFFKIHFLVKHDFLEEKKLSTLVCSPKHEPFAKLVDNTDDGGSLEITLGVNKYSRKMFHPIIVFKYKEKRREVVCQSKLNQ